MFVFRKAIVIIHGFTDFTAVQRRLLHPREGSAREHVGIEHARPKQRQLVGRIAQESPAPHQCHPFFVPAGEHVAHFALQRRQARNEITRHGSRQYECSFFHSFYYLLTKIRINEGKVKEKTDFLLAWPHESLPRQETVFRQFRGGITSRIGNFSPENLFQNCFNNVSKLFQQCFLRNFLPVTAFCSVTFH